MSFRETAASPSSPGISLMLIKEVLSILLVQLSSVEGRNLLLGLQMELTWTTELTNRIANGITTKSVNNIQ